MKNKAEQTIEIINDDAASTLQPCTSIVLAIAQRVDPDVSIQTTIE